MCFCDSSLTTNDGMLTTCFLTLIFLLQSEELPGGCPDLGQSVLDSPDLSLVPQAE